MEGEYQMKYLSIFLILLAGVLFVPDKPVMLASFDFGYNFRWGQSGTASGTTYFLSREDTGTMLREDGTKFLRQEAP
jgi:hypothetical protein